MFYVGFKLISSAKTRYNGGSGRVEKLSREHGSGRVKVTAGRVGSEEITARKTECLGPG